MKRAFFLAGLATMILSAQQFSKRKPEDEFVGAWKLISFERKNTAGEISYPLGQKPVGRLTYDALGRMSAQIMDPERAAFKAVSQGKGLTSEKAVAFDGYIAYYGSYTVNPAEHAVIHHVEACLYPNWVGSNQRRLYEFSGGQLILRAINGSGGPGTESRLVWERAR